ncbi:hypothetical protein CPC08DRAFT_705050 [Agrocybe pediades]|nr:hypothetical protein CPC08DRAFT_705050 [Agrocybe pediades]
MQPPTCVNLRVNTPAEALVICHAVYLGKLRMVTRRLDTDERRAINSGNVYVWEERGTSSDASGISSVGIERWTDSIQWGPSRVRDDFLYYQERRPAQPDFDMTSNSDSDTASQSRPRYHHQRHSLIKQTYSVYVNTPHGQRKWHLIAYFTMQTLEQLDTIHERPILSTLVVPPGMYRAARSPKPTRGRARSVRMPAPGFEPPPWSSPQLPHPSVRSIPDGTSSPRLLRNPSQTLAPLAFLQTRPPPNRHAMDETAIMSLPFDLNFMTKRVWCGT